MNSAALIRRLREGPLSLDEYPGLARSKESLKVRVAKLRSEGFVIRTHGWAEGMRGHFGTAYVLLSEPAHCCPNCGARA